MGRRSEVRGRFGDGAVHVILNVQIDEQLGVIARSSDDAVQTCRGNDRALFDLAFISQLEEIRERRADRDTYRSVGKRLFEQIFAGGVLALLRTLEDRVRGGSAPLFITLEMTRRWQQFPWELLWDPESSEFLALAADKALYRTTHTPVPPNPPATAFRLAIVAATPSDLEAIDVAAETRRVVEVVEGSGMAHEIAEVAQIDRGTLARTLRARSPSIVHFIGHGRFDQAQGSIALVGEKGKADWVDEHNLGVSLMGCSHVSLVVLNGCWTGASGARPFSGVGLKLVETSVPAVVAMQWSVRNGSAQIFARTLYELLGEGATVPQAVQAARKQVASERGADERDAFAPILVARGAPFSFSSSTSSMVRASAEPEPAGAQVPALPVLPVPAPSETFVPVPDTIESIRGALATPGGALLSAEGGYGKTEISRAIARAYGRRVVWIDAQQKHPDEAALVLDIADRAQGAFGVDLRELIRALNDPHLAESPRGHIPGRLAEALSASLAPMQEEGLLVIDDVHELSEALVAAIAVLVRRRNPHLKILLVTGAAEPDALQRLAEDKALRRFDRRYFAFDAQMAGEYIQRKFGRDIELELCQRLVTATEGWPMALALLDAEDVATAAALSQVIDELPGVPAEVYQALLQRAYQRQSVPAQRALAAMSVTRRLTGEWVNAVLDTVDGGATLRLLSASNAFVLASESSPDEWRLQTLFRAFASRRLIDQQGREQQRVYLQRSIDFWKREKQFITATIDALEHELWDAAAGCLEQGAQLLLDTARLTAFVSLAEKLPRDVLARFPLLSAHVAQALALCGDEAGARAVIANVGDWSASPEPHYAALIRVVAGLPDDPGTRAERAGQLARVRDDAHAAGEVLVAAQAALRRVELLTPSSSRDRASTEALSSELLTAEAWLHADDHPRAWDLRAHLLAAHVHLRGQENIGDTSAGALEASIRDPLGQDRASRMRAVERLVEGSRRVLELATRADDAARRSGSQLAIANVRYALSAYVVNDILNNERICLNHGIPTDAKRRDTILCIRLEDLVQVVDVYRYYEIPHNVAMAMVLIARILRMLGSPEATSTLDEVARVATSYGFADVLRQVESVREGMYDYDYVLRIASAAAADMTDEFLETQARELARIAGHPEQIATVRGELVQWREMHRARRAWCRHLDLPEADSMGHSSTDPRLILRNKVIQCLRFTDRRSLVPAPEFDTLFLAFKVTHCQGCPERSP